jgi:hypothetical protein
VAKDAGMTDTSQPLGLPGTREATTAPTMAIAASISPSITL